MPANESTSEQASKSLPPSAKAPAPLGHGPIPFAQVLWDELKHLKRHGAKEPPPTLEKIYEQIGALPPEEALSALCLSGGGIRSATFNLGVIQALAKLGLLGRFDYLSSVSGGGYIAGWLKAWLHREAMADVAAALAEPARAPGFDPLVPEPRPLDHLREYSNYLTPRVGLFSADTWAAGAMIVRNLILNWLVLVPVLAAFVAIPQAALIIASASPPAARWGWGALALAVAFATWASAAIYHFRRRRSEPATEPTILRLAVAPLWLACLFLSLAALWLYGEYEDRGLMVFCLLWCVLIPLAGWIFALKSASKQEAVPPWRSDLAGIVLSGVVAGVLLFAIARSWLPALRDKPPLFVIFAVPILLGVYLLARALFVAFASLGESDKHGLPLASSASERAYADREWWARLSGWVLILTIAWTGISSLVILGGFYLGLLTADAVAAAGGVSGLITALLGASRGTPATGDSKPKQPWSVKELALRLFAPVTVACIVLVLAKLSAWAARLATGLDDLLHMSSPASRLVLPEGKTLVEVVLSFLLVPFLFALLSWLLGWVVNVNRFSAHGLYRNRLVRAYLGASNPNRRPDPFTGFDAHDNLRLHDLAGGASPRPLSVINATLNLVESSEHLAWQQRKAESFSMTPLYCGNFHEGYRRSEEYGDANGISLGTAITISGAAANPNAGYHSSPLVAFLMTLFNVRLGCWLGNPNEHGQRVYRYSGPRHAWKPLFGDLFGQTDASHAYVNLSDGGHFENLGVYEMVLRRCRFIVVSDAGEDPEHDFEDLGGLIRKVRIDFGIPIEFEQPIHILARSSEGQRGLLCALGTIRYDLVDHPRSKRGKLLYMKPTVLAEGPPVPYDVFSYARASLRFPHEPTTDQWFSEAQFESYRALGQHLAGQLGAGQIFADIPTFFDAVQKGLEQAAGTQGSGVAKSSV